MRLGSKDMFRLIFFVDMLELASTKTLTPKSIVFKYERYKVLRIFCVYLDLMLVTFYKRILLGFLKALPHPLVSIIVVQVDKCSYVVH